MGATGGTDHPKSEKVTKELLELRTQDSRRPTERAPLKIQRLHSQNSSHPLRCLPLPPDLASVRPPGCMMKGVFWRFLPAGSSGPLRHLLHSAPARTQHPEFHSQCQINKPPYSGLACPAPLLRKWNPRPCVESLPTPHFSPPLRRVWVGSGLRTYRGRCGRQAALAGRRAGRPPSW